MLHWGILSLSYDSTFHLPPPFFLCCLMLLTACTAAPTFKHASTAYFIELAWSQSDGEHLCVRHKSRRPVCTGENIYLSHFPWNYGGICKKPGLLILPLQPKTTDWCSCLPGSAVQWHNGPACTASLRINLDICFLRYIHYCREVFVLRVMSAGTLHLSQQPFDGSFLNAGQMVGTWGRHPQAAPRS